MTPLEQQVSELQQQVQTLMNFMVTFQNVSQLDPQLVRTITQTLSAASSKTSASATQAVNEAGTGTYNVMKAPDGFISIGGKNVPYIN